VALATGPNDEEEVESFEEMAHNMGQRLSHQGIDNIFPRNDK